MTSEPPTERERSTRRTFIVHVGIVRCGLPLGLAAFLWVTIAQFGTTLEHLRTAGGWLRLGVLFLLAVGEWTLGAGWLLGMLLWSLRRARDESTRGSQRPRSP